MTKTTTFQKVIKELADAFETATRDGAKPGDEGATYVRMKVDRPAWLEGSDFMHDVHAAIDGRLPDDWIFAHTALIADEIIGHDCTDADEARDAMHEIADGLVDVYNHDRLMWLASNNGNAELCDEAVEELGSGDADTDTLTRIGLGQYLALTRIGDAIISACEAEADRRDTDAEGDAS